MTPATIILIDCNCLKVNYLIDLQWIIFKIVHYVPLKCSVTLKNNLCNQYCLVNQLNLNSSIKICKLLINGLIYKTIGAVVVSLLLNFNAV